VGATVATTTSAANVDLVKSLGADVAEAGSWRPQFLGFEARVK